jgi:hypothetical protein
MKTNGPDDTPSGDLDRKVVNTASTNVNKVNIGQHWSTQAEAEAEAEAEKTYNADSRIALVFLREKSDLDRKVAPKHEKARHAFMNAARTPRLAPWRPLAAF